MTDEFLDAILITIKEKGGTALKEQQFSYPILVRILRYNQIF